MPTIIPSYADLLTQIRQVVKVHHIIYRSAVDGGLFTQTNNAYVTQEEVSITSLDTIFGQRFLAALSGTRELLNVIVVNFRETMVPLLEELGRVIGSTSSDIDTILFDYYQYLIDNALEFKEPAPTLGTPAADGGNVGNGTLLRLSVDKNGYTDYRGQIGVLTFECFADKFSGTTEGNETWFARGDTRFIDEISVGDGGIVNINQSVQVRGFDHSSNLLANSGFEGDDTVNTAATDGEEVFQDWLINGTPGDLTKITIDNTLADVRNGLQVLKVASDTVDPIRIEQVITLPGAAAYLFAWVFSMFAKRDAGGTGTITIYWGNKSQAFDIATDLGTSYGQLNVDLDKDVYLENFRPASGDLTAGFDFDVTAGTVWIDNLYFGPMDIVNNSGYLLSPGSRDTGSWREGDKFTVTDTNATLLSDGIMYYWLGRHFGAHVPTSGTPSANEIDPSFT